MDVVSICVASYISICAFIEPVDIYIHIGIQKRRGDYTYTYNPCYHYNIGGSGCTNVAVSHITISYCMHVG